MMNAGNSIRRGGFSLLELLAIVAIALILAIAVIPNIGAGFSGTQLATASRNMLQAAKFARTMALLHQVEMELVLTSAGEGAGPAGAAGNAKIEVRLLPGRGPAPAPGRGEEPPDGDTRDDDDLPPPDDFPDGEGDYGGAAKTSAESTGAAMEDFAGEVHSEISCGTVVFELLRFTDDGEEDFDAPPGGAAPEPPEEPGEDFGDGREASGGRVSLVFDSDGTCRPFELLIRDGEDGECNIVRIDRWGKGKVEPYEE